MQARQNTAQLIKILGDTTYQNVYLVIHYPTAFFFLLSMCSFLIEREK